MNIGRLAEDNITRFGEYDLVWFGGKWHTNVEMNRIANRLGNALKRLGVKRGDRVGVQLVNCPQLMQAFFAAFKIGAIMVPINPALRVAELSYLYKDAGLVALVSTVDYMETIRQAREGADELRHVILTGEPLPKDAISYDAAIRGESDELTIEDTDNNDTAVMIFPEIATWLPNLVFSG